MFGLIEVMFPILFFLVFSVILVMIVVTAARSFAQSRKNAASPRVTAPATLVAKRYSIHTHHSGENHMSHTYNSYYATFEFESGDRAEFSVPSEFYGLAVEGDRGTLLFQGTKFISFTRV